MHPQIYVSIDLWAEKYDLDPDFVQAIIKTESNYNPIAIGKAGELGLMQLTWRAIQDAHTIVQDSMLSPYWQPYRILNIDNNIQYGCAYLRWIINKYESEQGEKPSLEKIYMCYNMGYSRAKKHKFDPRNAWESTVQGHIQNLMENYNKIKSMQVANEGKKND